MIIARAALAMPELGVRMSTSDPLASSLLTRNGCSSFCSQLVVIRHNFFDIRLSSAWKHIVDIGTFVLARSESPRTQSSTLYHAAGPAQGG